MTAENPQKHGEGNQNGCRDVDGNAARDPQVDTAQQHSGNGTADDIVGKAQKRIQNIHIFPGFQLRKGRGAGSDIHSLSHGADHGVVRHDAAEGDQQEAPGGEGRVHEVFAKPAEQTLYNQDGEDAAHHGHVQGYAAGQAQGQQHTGHGGAAVLCGIGLMRCQTEQPLRHNGAEHTDKNNQECVKSVKIHTYCGSGQQGSQYLPHGAGRGQGTADMGAGGQIGY